jgi:hypothetical protein
MSAPCIRCSTRRGLGCAQSEGPAAPNTFVETRRRAGERRGLASALAFFRGSVSSGQPAPGAPLAGLRVVDRIRGVRGAPCGRQARLQLPRPGGLSRRLGRAALQPCAVGHAATTRRGPQTSGRADPTRAALMSCSQHSDPASRSIAALSPRGQSGAATRIFGDVAAGSHSWCTSCKYQTAVLSLFRRRSARTRHWIIPVNLPRN